MTANADLDRQLAWWFVDQATANAPEGLLERSLAGADATRQRPGWLVGDRGRSQRTAGRPATGRPVLTRARAGRLLAVGMAVVVVAAVGINRKQAARRRHAYSRGRPPVCPSAIAAPARESVSFHRSARW